MNDPSASDSKRFELKVDGSRAMIRYRMTGLWDEATLDQFHDAILNEMRKFRSHRKPFDLLGDLTDFPPQPQKLNEKRETLVQEAVAMGLRKCGVVTNSPLVKLQLSHISNQSYAFFPSEADALAWINA